MDLERGASLLESEFQFFNRVHDKWSLTAGPQDMELVAHAMRVILDPMEMRLAAGSWQQGLQLLTNPSGWRDLRNLMDAVREAGRALGLGLHSYIKQEDK